MLSSRSSHSSWQKVVYSFCPRPKTISKLHPTLNHQLLSNMASPPSFFVLSRSTSLSFLILFLFFPMHARKSNACSFRVTANAGSLKEFLVCKVKIGEKIELRKDSFEQEANANGRQHPMPSGRIPDRFDSIFGSKAVKEKDKDPRWKSGRKVVESSSRMNFLEATKTEVSRGSAAEQDMTLEAKGSHNNIGDEDIIKTDDYQRQHHDSPIHNK